jgi:hypothetical protein
VRIVRCTVGVTLSFCLLAGYSQQAAATDDLIVAIATLLTGVDPITVTEISVVFSAVALPLTYLPILIVANDPEYLGEHVNGRMLNGVALVYMVIILVASIAAIPLLIIKHFLEGPSSPALRNPCPPACPVLIAGHERSGVRSPRPIAALVRWRHRDSFLVRWEDIERLDVRRVNLRPGFTKVSSQLP